ncbi:putative thioesterase [Saccharomonospora marina XMU15]|uniref:Putative thioesterase n=1 Tax=Saccharomonospora marina XMU15 TaxID=882083 RepID=H5X3F4_9PSEU|nr:thioesterase family protein [Saccharomonospora marina]EHR49888.1 putative thioesterase [Saccharomonospora marina XMU15]
MTVGQYVALVRPRWSDMDVFGHVNHANLVTLLEEARVPLLFDGAEAKGLSEFAKGIVVVRLEVAYRTPIVVDGREVRVEITLSQLRHASFTLDYLVRTGCGEGDEVAATASTVLAPYDVNLARPRRLTASERAYLSSHLPGGAPR